MVDEESPLLALANYEAVQVVKESAKKIANSEAAAVATEAASVATESAKKVLTKAKKYANMASTGQTGLRMLAFLGGCSIVIDSILCFIWDVFTLHFIAALIDFYTFFIGIAAIVMESAPDVLPYSRHVRSFFERYFGFTLSGTGRGLFYFVAGTLVVSKDPSLRSQASGFFVMILGLLYVFSSLSAARKMKELRIKSFSKREISAKFKKYDEDDNGQLDFDEFHKLLIDLNIDINRNEAETLFLRADRDVLYGIDFEEFTRFWEECDRF